jgi:inosine-uridine nucleoside N-ribohydrolase
LSLAALAGHPDIPVSCGRETPLQGDHAFPIDWRVDVDTLSGLTLPENPASPSTQSAVELLTTTIQSSPEKVTILTLGPLTNLAETLLTTPELKNKIEMVYIMGGAVDVPGNVGISVINNPSAEWNIYCDPHAADIVFESGVSITLIPLAATNHAPATIRFYGHIKKDHSTPEAALVFDVLTKGYDFIKSRILYFWDPLAAAILTDNSLATFETKTVTIIEEAGPDSGRTQVSENGASIRVAVNADSKQFEQLFLDTLNAPE